VSFYDRLKKRQWILFGVLVADFVVVARCQSQLAAIEVNRPT
jgi:hypothetical protein